MTAVLALPEVVALATAGTDNPKADFSDTPLWLSLVKALIIFVYLLVSTLLVIWFERRVIGRMQQRPGPNRNGPFGLLQTLADGMKSMLKEDVRPKAADVFVFTLAPLITATMCFVSFSIIPLAGRVSMFGHETPFQLTDTSVAVLLVLAVAGVGIYGVVLAGWSSGSTYPLMGGLRATAQMISYEIAMGLSLLGAVMMAGSLSLVSIVEAQDEIWFIVPQFVGFVIFMVAGFAETNRAPFDLPEADAELVQGFQTEYGGTRFASFLLAEYLEMFVVSGIAAAFFLGGWMGPGPGWLDPFWMVAKIMALIFVFIWVRATLPRLRYDQLMSLGWKFLLPLATLNVLVTAVLVVVW